MRADGRDTRPPRPPRPRSDGASAPTTCPSTTTTLLLSFLLIASLYYPFLTTDTDCMHRSASLPEHEHLSFYVLHNINKGLTATIRCSLAASTHLCAALASLEFPEYGCRRGHAPWRSFALGTHLGHDGHLWPPPCRGAGNVRAGTGPGPRFGHRVPKSGPTGWAIPPDPQQARGGEIPVQRGP